MKNVEIAPDHLGYKAWWLDFWGYVPGTKEAEEAWVAKQSMHLSPTKCGVMGLVQQDIHYTSPVDGTPITTMRKRKNDLARTGSRPWEGMAAETAEAKRRVAEDEKRNDRKLDENVKRAFYQLSPEKRRHLGG